MRELSVRNIKRLLLDFHSRKGYEIFKSFPLVTNDPTVIFTNATITPFKNWFTSPDVTPCNFALVQKCFRSGGSCSVDEMGHNPNIHAFFEMFGTGMFGVDHVTTIKHLFEMLDAIGIERKKLYFTIPPGDSFRTGLEANGILPRRIYSIENNGVFWCKWQFGRCGPTGSGLTAIYSLRDEEVSSLSHLESEAGNFVELLNLIHIYGQEGNDGLIIPATNPGFEIGMGIERIATILQNCDGYQIDNIHPLVEIVVRYFSGKWLIKDMVTPRACTEYLRGICMLSVEGLLPSSKGAGYVFRKIIRKLMEHVWLAAEKPLFAENLIKEFVYLMNFQDPSLRISESVVVDILRKEHALLEEVLNRGIRVIKKNPDLSERILLDTYGLSPGLIQLIKKGEQS
jgi:alanyl-tRNA synthetase